MRISNHNFSAYLNVSGSDPIQFYYQIDFRREIILYTGQLYLFELLGLVGLQLIWLIIYCTSREIPISIHKCLNSISIILLCNIAFMTSFCYIYTPDSYLSQFIELIYLAASTIFDAFFAAFILMIGFVI